MTQSDSGFDATIRRLIEDARRAQEDIKRLEFERIQAEIMAKKAERVPDKYKGNVIKIKPAPRAPARKKAASKRSSEVAPAKPASIYPPWPKV